MSMRDSIASQIEGGGITREQSDSGGVVSDLKSIVRLSQDLAAERARADSLTASIVKACEGTGCVNAHELAEELRQARAELMAAKHLAAEIMNHVHNAGQYNARGAVEQVDRCVTRAKDKYKAWLDRKVEPALSRANGGGE